MDRYRLDAYRNFPPSPSFLPLSLALCTVVLACHYTDVHFPGLDFPRNRSLSTLFSVTLAPAEIIRLFCSLYILSTPSSFLPLCPFPLLHGIYIYSYVRRLLS